MGVLGYTWRVEPHWLKVVHRKLPMPDLPDYLAGKTLVQISDLHFGTTDVDYLIRTLQRVNEMVPDILVITGDFVTPLDGLQTVEEMRPHLTTLKPAKIATLGVLGNHDYGPSWSDRNMAAAVAEVARECGIDVLMNDVRDVKGLRIAGVEDPWSKYCRLRETLALTGDEPAHLVLCHNPDAADWPGGDNFKGWMLSGHTHGGQCKAPFFRPPLLPVKNKEYDRGAFKLGAGRRLYVNAGLGYSMRVRFNVRPEMTRFELVNART